MMPDNGLECFRPFIKRANELSSLFGSRNVSTVHILLAIIDMANEELKSALETQIEPDSVIEVFNSGAFPEEPSILTKQVLLAGLRAKRRSSGIHENSIYLLMGIIAHENSVAYQILNVLHGNLASLQERLAAKVCFTVNVSRGRQAEEPNLINLAITSGETAPSEQNLAPLAPLNLGPRSVLASAGKDLTLLASQGKIDPVIGRDEEIKKGMRILLKRKKNNPVFIGEAGVGKTAVVEGMALCLAKGINIPEKLKGKRIYSLSLTSLTAGTQFRGQFEARMDALINEIKKNENVIIFIDELHTLLGAGSAEGSLDAANILKPSLARGDFACIGATTSDEYRKYIEKDSALERRFQPVKIEEPDEKTTLRIIFEARQRYEKHHGVKYTDKALEAAVKLSARFIHDRNFPDKAIDVIDEAGSRKALESMNNAPLVNEEDIEKIISEWSGVATISDRSQRNKLLNLKNALSQNIIGQKEAIDLICESLLSFKIGKQPIGSFVFLGPTGVGKTEVARKLALFLLGSEEALVKFDMSEYQEKHQISKFIGAAPGYVGYDEGGELVNAIRKKPYAVILFDEIEKAHSDIFDILLQVLDDGILTDNHGKKAYFENTVIIMTSNIRPPDKKTIGFGSSDATIGKDDVHDALMKNGFRLEFLNRIDEIVLFENITKSDMKAILDLRLKELSKQVEVDKEIRISFSDEAKKLLIEKGFSEKFGARELKRTVKRMILSPLGKRITSKEIQKGDEINVVAHEGGIEFIKIDL